MASNAPVSQIPLKMTIARLRQSTNIAALVDGILAIWPEHRDFIEKSLADRTGDELAQLDELAASILVLAAGDRERFLSSYRWLCRVINEEQLHFMRHGKYRHSKFADVYEEVYSNAPYMQKYVEGILVSQLIWANHADSYMFHRRFMTGWNNDYRYLEIGPGHGLYLAIAAASPKCRTAEAWDISETSLSQTRESLNRLGVKKDVCLRRQDILSAGPDNDCFDIIAICEVLEHLEDPAAALRALRMKLAPGGRIVINVPINSPAPDHIYLLDTVDAVRKLVTSSGLTIDILDAFPMTGYDLEQAMKLRASVSCAVVASASG